jgi:antitoxin (DNA-binding transcriptional repressor) of toxin-antitoxin stability system
MIIVSSTECRKRFHKYIRVAEGGEVVFVTRHGKPWFELTRHEPKPPLKTSSAPPRK